MAGPKVSALALMAVAGLALGGCAEGQQPFGFLKKKDAAAQGTADGAAQPAPQESSVKLVDRDVEAPDVFQVTSKGLWDGRPSLGGVWAAYPGVKDPERVIIRNPKNGKFVIGALFRRENNNPGPKLQLSSDAATALGLFAGEPATVSVTALRRVEAPVPAPNAKKPALDANEQVAAKAAPGKVTAKPLKDITATAGAAIAKAESTTTKKPSARPEQIAAATKTPAAKAAVQAPPPKPTAGGRDYLQIGIFSIEANANRAATMVSKAGAMVQVKTEPSHGKTFWRVLAGPATSTAQRDALTEAVKKLGFKDAFFVRG